VTDAEEDALEAIYALVIRLDTSNFASSPSEVSKAKLAVERWVHAAE